MKIIRWFLSHIFLILLVIIVIYGYMFWGNLLGKKTPAGQAIAYLSSEFVVVGEFVEAVKAKQAQLSTKNTKQPATARSEEVTAKDVVVEKVVIEEIIVEEHVADEPVVEEVVVKELVAKEPVIQKMPVDKPATVVDGYGYHPETPVREKTVPPVAMVQHNIKPQAMANEQGLNPVKSDSVKNVQSPAAAGNSQQAVSAPPANNSFISEKVEKQLENVDESGRIIDPSLQAVDVRESWLTARKSYYQRKYDVSEKSYQNVINNTQDNFDAYGELGNVYFNQGKNKQAAQAYFSAASILLRKGQANRARSLLGLLYHLDKEKAVELQKLLTSASS